jgi:hypothetical protein
VPKVRRIEFEVQYVPLPPEKAAAWRAGLAMLVRTCIDSIAKPAEEGTGLHPAQVAPTLDGTQVTGTDSGLVLPGYSKNDSLCVFPAFAG